MITRSSIGPLAASLIAASLALASSDASAISRDEVMSRAEGFTYHQWTATSANLGNACDHNPYYTAGDYMGLPYDWGGYVTLFEFDQQIANGYGAGTDYYDLQSCTTGLDCSGFVSKVWDTGHFSTSSMDQISSVIGLSELKEGDILNDAGNHVVLFSHELASGEAVIFQALQPNVHMTHYGLSAFQGYIPRRYQSISDVSGNTQGTLTNPIVIGSLPYSDSRNTAQSLSDMLDGCGDDPSKNESGPEYVYQVQISQPGLLTATVLDDAGVDIDVHLYETLNTSDCTARHDSAITVSVDCGTYYVVADTYGGDYNAGNYTLTVNFDPGGGACGSGPPQYDFGGALGEPCGGLGYCNPTLGGETCLTDTSNNSDFCTQHCSGDADCASIAGCCVDISNDNSGQFYCLTSSYCGGGGGGGTGGSSSSSSSGSSSSSSSSSGNGGANGTGGDGSGAATGSSSSSGSAGDADDDGATTSSCSVADPGGGNGDGWGALAVLMMLGLARRRR